MVVFSFYIFDRHADCIYKRKWIPKATQLNGPSDGPPQGKALSAEDDAKLVFGTIFSLRNMVRKLGGPDDKYVVVKNPLSPIEHPGGVGVNCEMFELGLEQFITATLQG
ncbi:TRAPP subunit bet5 [Schaereria dolodes]|nr:TRAPP subunit bet5 [Schaereria dolodes]